MASRSVNKVILIGNLGKDAESKFTPNGTSVATFSIATSWRRKDPQTGEWKDQTDWHNITLWRSENVVPYLTKGTQVYVEGRLHTRSYEKDGKKQYFTEVIAEELILLSGRRGEAAGGGDYSQQPVSMPRSAQRPAATAASPAPAEDPGFDQGITDDDVPF
jgi:single-strand DNA-binding protein